MIVLDPDVAKSFRNSAAVNDALRSLLDATRSTKRLTKAPGGRSAKSSAHRPSQMPHLQAELLCLLRLLWLVGYLRASGIEHGVLINFGSPRLQIKKYILNS